MKVCRKGHDIMKKKFVCFMLLCFSLCVFGGCAKHENAIKNSVSKQEDTQQDAVTDNDEMTTKGNESTKQAGTSGESAVDNAGKLTTSENGDYPLMVMLEDKLFVDTGEISQSPRCGNMDFTFTSHVKSGEPKENGQTNFDSPVEGQYGIRENRIELYYDDAWHIFAFQEDDFNGVTMRVTKFDNKGAVLTVCNDTEEDIGYGEDFILERYNEETATWEYVTIYGDRDSDDESVEKPKYGFHDILYYVEKQSTKVVTVNWKDYYGELPKGRYRIIKKFIDLHTDAKVYDTHSLMAEFKLTGKKNDL